MLRDDCSFEVSSSRHLINHILSIHYMPVDYLTEFAVTSYFHLQVNYKLCHDLNDSRLPYKKARLKLRKSFLLQPPHLRGRLNQLYQLVLTFFILVAQVTLVLAT